MHVDAGPDEARRAATASVMDRTFELVRLVSSHRARKDGRSARLLLFPVDRCGPLRQSALAELAHTDPSTTSRHVADLVAEGLVERIPDPADGRASLLALTPGGAAALDQMRSSRDERASAALHAWTTPEITAFTADLARYTRDLELMLLEHPHVHPHPTGPATPVATAPTPSQED